MNTLEIQTLASELDQALLKAHEIERLTVKHPSLDLVSAYHIQDEGVRLRQMRGEKILGYKMGLTSEAKIKQMNLDQPIYGILTDRMQIQNGETFSLQTMIHPKIEPEIFFVTDRELKGKVSADQALAACSQVGAALEILDSRFVGFKYFSLPDVVADNCSSSRFVLGVGHQEPKNIDVTDLEITLEINGQAAQKARSKDVLGHPLNSLVRLCEILDSRGLSLPAKSIVLTGAATQAVALEPGMQVRVVVENLGEARVSVTRQK